MNKVKLTAISNITTGKLDSNAAVGNGIYPYFTCAPEPLHINEFVFDCDAILLAGNNASGNFHCQRYKGKFNAYQRTYVITAKEGYDIDYIYYNLLISLQNLKKVSQGSQTKFLTMQILDSFEIENVEIDKQIGISKILANLDKKIRLNEEINSELEIMAKTIYDYWFLQYDFPDENGKPYKSSGGKMIWNEELKREIPVGWEVSDLSPYITITRGVTYDENDIKCIPEDGYIPLLKSNNIQNNKLLLEDVIYVDRENVSNEQYLSNNSVFVTMSSGSTEHVGKIAIIFYDMPYCYGAFCSKIEIRKEYKCFLSLFFASDYFKRKIQTIVVGTNIKNISNTHLLNNKLAMPSENILKKFEGIITPFFNKQGKIIRENQELVSLRDFLIPLFMNGQVGFRED